MIIQWNRQINGYKRHLAYSMFGQQMFHTYIAKSATPAGPGPFWNANTGMSALAGGDIDIC